MRQSIKCVKAIGNFFNSIFANNTNMYSKTEISNLIDQKIAAFQSSFETNNKSIYASKTDLENLKKEVKDLKTKEVKKENEFCSGLKLYFPVLFVVRIFVLIFVLASVFLLVKYDVGIENENIVLVFMGILATFVVISNYAQVQQIKNDFDDKIKDVEDIEERVKETERRIAGIEIRMSDGEHISNAKLCFNRASNNILNKKNKDGFLDCLDSIYHCLNCSLIPYDMVKAAVEKVMKIIPDEDFCNVVKNQDSTIGSKLYFIRIKTSEIDSKNPFNKITLDDLQKLDSYVRKIIHAKTHRKTAE